MRQRSAKHRFLEAFAEYGVIQKACEVSSVPRANVYRWQESDERFGFAFNQANAIATERLEEEARRRAHDGVDKPVFYLGEQCGAVREYSDGLLQFLLKARNPGKYKERLSVESTSTVKAYGGVDIDAV